MCEVVWGWFFVLGFGLGCGWGLVCLVWAPKVLFCLGLSLNGLCGSAGSVCVPCVMCQVS
jgi:hypothetical protein